MNHANIKNIPKNPKEIFDLALDKSFKYWIDEKGTADNPGIIQRRLSNLSYEQAFSIIQENNPHWTIHFRNESRLNMERDYWEFGGCNIASNGHGEFFIWILVDTEESIKIFEKFNLQINEFTIGRI
jgi:hypothetical protein